MANPKEAYPGLFAARSVSGLITYDDSSWLESQGQTIIDYFFDDGRHLFSRKQALLAVNANSSHKEGAWQFIEFLLKEEAQARLMAYNDVPVSKIVFEKAAKSQLENGPLTESILSSSVVKYWNGSFRERMYYQEKKLSQEEMIERLWRTQEEVEEIRTALEHAKPLPLRTVPILEIIYEEASYYFNDVKTLEEVTAIITNRVQLYLDESLL